MAIHVALKHTTHYAYDRVVGHAPHVVRLRPAPHCRTPILSYSLNILPRKHFINWQQDPFSNWNGRLVFPEKSDELCLEVDLVAEMAVYNSFDFFLEPAAEEFPFEYEPALESTATEFVLQPGNTLYVPRNWPHWVDNGDQVSMSLSINLFRLAEFALERFYTMNDWLRDRVARASRALRPDGSG